MAIASRLTHELLGSNTLPHIPAAAWRDTTVQLPSHGQGAWIDVLTGKRYEAKDGKLALSELLSVLPVALLESAD